ncbi:CatB-related O-acetyltransferase [Enterococcus dispar]|uniref:CatB-related O-acetyltransferase n=1 Tax=Enterococcus dispar TaxID=44009 RepID=UPI00288D62D2|nr:CatB-related O-acetyltransferase [Enterococcus dispar]MDT2706165.1 CatB-related O-acetyltransferase [Enterococcus dispar]
MLKLLLENIIGIPQKVYKNISVFSVLRNTVVQNNSYIGRFSKMYDSSIGEFSYCGDSCIIIRCSVGKFTSIGSNCQMGLAKHPTNYASLSPVFLEGKNKLKTNLSWIKFNPYQQEIKIGNDVWIGNNVIVMQGVSIGNGAVIGAGSIVTRDIEDYEIWAGNPAKFIRKRFSNEIIDELQKLSWWDMDQQIIKKMANYIEDIDKFIEEGRKY